MAEVFRFPDHVPIPPTTAKKSRTSCQYCIVGCGYTVYVWPTDVPEGGLKASENALGVDLPAAALSGQWISPGMYNRTVFQDGRSYNIVIVPDKDYAVNHGNHSIRGGTNAQGIWSPFGPTADRLAAPLLKVGGAQQPISWDAALTIASGVLKHAVSKYGPQGTAFRMYAYQWFENTYSITKLYFQQIQTPNGAIHNRASFGGETTALGDTGLDTWNIAYVDAEMADVVFEVGAGGYENQTVFFTQHVMNHGAKLIVQDPRKIIDAAYAEKNGGLHLQLKPGTDAVLLNAIARVIVDNSWQDTNFISQFIISSKSNITSQDNWRQQHFGMALSDYQKMLQNPLYETANAAQFTGVSASQIQMAAALANLALLVGSIGQVGRGISRSARAAKWHSTAGQIRERAARGDDTPLRGPQVRHDVWQGDVHQFRLDGVGRADIRAARTTGRRVLGDQRPGGRTLADHVHASTGPLYPGALALQPCRDQPDGCGKPRCTERGYDIAGQ
jgi:arsenite oxidase large subunit